MVKNFVRYVGSSLIKIIAAGSIALVFVGITVGIVNFVIEGISAIDWYLLVLFILFAGLAINILGGKKFHRSSSPMITIARSLRNFAESIVERKQKAIEGSFVRFDDLFGISSLREENRRNTRAIMEALLAILPQDSPAAESLKNTIEEAKKREKLNDYSAGIYVLSVINPKKERKDVIASSSPTPFTGFVLGKVKKDWLLKEELFEIIQLITSGALLGNDSEAEKNE